MRTAGPRRSPITSQGHAVSSFARAVKTGNHNIVVAAAAELPRVSLVDALLVLLVFVGARAPQTEAAAVRWAARYLTEVRPTPRPREAHLVLSAACALGGPSDDVSRAFDEWEPPEL